MLSDSAAFVMLDSLATARKYCNTRISMLFSNTDYTKSIVVMRSSITVSDILFKYGKVFNICI